MNAYFLQIRPSLGRRFVAALLTICMLGVHPALAQFNVQSETHASPMECCCEAEPVEVMECCEEDEAAVDEVAVSESRISSHDAHHHMPMGAKACCVSDGDFGTPYTMGTSSPTRSLSNASSSLRILSDRSCLSKIAPTSGVSLPGLYSSSPSYIALASLRR